MAHVADIEWIVVGSELEALILEMNLIKRHRPKYNVRLKDDKRYPYIKVHWADPFPKVTVTRRMDDDGSRYFGPYTSAWAVHQTLDVLRRIFPYLTCDRVITGQDPRACLYSRHQAVPGAVHRGRRPGRLPAMIDDLCRFLEGETEPVVSRLRGEMDARLRSACTSSGRPRCATSCTPSRRSSSGRRSSRQERIDSDVIAFARDQTATPACRSSSSAAAS